MTESDAHADLSWPMFLVAFLGVGFGVGLFQEFYRGATGDLFWKVLGAAAFGVGFLSALLFVWLVYWIVARVVFRSTRRITPRRTLATAAAVFGAFVIAGALLQQMLRQS